MKKRNLLSPVLVVTLATFATASVTVTAPANNSTVSPTVQYVATATTNCSKGVSAILRQVSARTRWLVQSSILFSL